MQITSVPDTLDQRVKLSLSIDELRLIRELYDIAEDVGRLPFDARPFMGRVAYEIYDQACGGPG
jgi:hypothetical protein